MMPLRDHQSSDRLPATHPCFPFRYSDATLRPLAFSLWLR